MIGSLAAKPWLIIGAGYSGQRLAHHLRREGARVCATSRDATTDESIALQKAGVELYAVDFLSDEPLPEIPGLEGGFAVISVPPARGGTTQDALLERRIARWCVDLDIRRAVYWSATSVYGSSEGAKVIDRTPEAPNTSVGIRRYDAERRLLAEAARIGLDVDIMRLVGIYGPHRTIRRRIARGDYRLVEGGYSLSNRIHVDDIVSATLHILNQPHLESRWVVSDGHPFVIREMVEWVCEELGLSLPEEVPLSALSERAQSFWKGNRRAHPLRLLTTGWRPRYPSYVEGLRASWAEEEEATAG